MISNSRTQRKELCCLFSSPAEATSYPQAAWGDDQDYHSGQHVAFLSPWLLCKTVGTQIPLVTAVLVEMEMSLLFLATLVFRARTGVTSAKIPIYTD